MPKRKLRTGHHGQKQKTSPKETVIVTGGSGLIGVATADRLAKSYNVVIFDVRQPPPLPSNAEWVEVDLTSDRSVERGLEHVRHHYGEQIASVIHLAAYYDFSGEPSPKYEEITVRGTERLLRGLQRFHLEQFVFSSSMLVHAPCEPGQHINEDWPLDPRWDYPKSKIETEKLILAERGNIPVVLLRIAGVYDDVCHSLPLAHQIQRIYERRLISHLFPGSIMHGQAFLHVDDLLDAFSLLVRRRAKLPPALTLLLGEPETLSYDELQQTLGSLLHGEKWETREIPKQLAKTEVWFEDMLPLPEKPFIKPWMIDFADDHYALDITRAGTLLGWEPQRRLRGSLPKMIAALKADPHGWYHAHRLNHTE
jgi:nucleoside-diphosphate-sugar epimerase